MNSLVFTINWHHKLNNCGETTSIVSAYSMDIFYPRHTPLMQSIKINAQNSKSILDFHIPLFNI